MRQLARKVLIDKNYYSDDLGDIEQDISDGWDSIPDTWIEVKVTVEALYVDEQV